MQQARPPQLWLLASGLLSPDLVGDQDMCLPCERGKFDALYVRGDACLSMPGRDDL